MHRPFCLVVLAVLLIAGRLEAGVVQQPHVGVELVAENTALVPGTTQWIGLHFILDKKWHIYWTNPGDSGEAPVMKWTLPPGFQVGEISWPRPSRITLGPLVSYGYLGDVVLALPLTVPANATGTVELKADADWLVCHDACIPGKATLSLSLPVQATSAAGLSAPLFAAARAQLPVPPPADWHGPFIERGDGFDLVLPLALKDAELYFFALDATLLNAGAPQTITKEKDRVLLQLKKADQSAKIPKEIKGVLSDGKNAYAVSFPVEAAPAKAAVTATAGASAGAVAPVASAQPAASASPAGPVAPVSPADAGSDSLISILLLAFLGGAVLNLMPCVFPVLAIKALGLVRSAAEGARQARVEALCYAAGVICSFWVLAGTMLLLKAGGSAVGWGFQLQSPIFVATLICLLFTMALSLLETMPIEKLLPTGALLDAGNSLASKPGAVGGFFSGVLSTIVATPCTAPFMGTALGFAASQSALVAFTVFTALGVGLAGPYVLLAFVPALGRLLPKPGRWMETFKQAMAFPLFATTIWLCWVLGLEAGLNGVLGVLAAALLLSISGWILLRWEGRLARGVVWLLILGAMASAYSQANISNSRREDSGHEGPWETFSPKRLAELEKAGKPVFIDFTAAWCLTCKANELVALTPDVLAKMKARGITLLRADWTKADPQITQALAEFGRNGVPLYVIKTGRPGDAPRILPQVLTSSLVLSEIEKLQ